MEHLRPGLTLLDIGCGPGTITADLAELVAPGRVVALDNAPDVLADARQLAGERELSNLEFAAADVYTMDYPDDGFDIVHAHQVLQHLPDPVAALREMRRVCRPGGLVAVRDGDYGAMTWYPPAPELDSWQTMYQAVARANGGEPDAGRRLRSWALRAGFTEVTSSASVWCYAEPAERDWWGGLWADRVLHSKFAEHAVSGGHASSEDLRRVSQGWRDWARTEHAWFAILNGEILCRA